MMFMLPLTCLDENLFGMTLQTFRARFLAHGVLLVILISLSGLMTAEEDCLVIELQSWISLIGLNLMTLWTCIQIDLFIPRTMLGRTITLWK